MRSDILHCRLFRRPFDARHGWTRAGRLSVRIERGGVAGILTEVGWRAEDGAETSLTLPELVGSYRSPDGEIWELRGEPAPEKVGELADAAVYRVFEGDTEQPLTQHPQNPLRLLLDTGEGHPVRLSWRSAGGEGGHVVFAPPFQDRNTAKVADIQATAEHSEAGEVAGIRAIERAEARLGQRLPPSVRSFYQVTDGLLEAGAFGERVWSLAELDWMRETNADLLDLWGMFVADSGPQARALQIGANDDGDYWFLDPADVRDDEWAAYTWHPAHGADAVRHDSFAAMLADQRTTLERIRARRGRPAHPEGADVFLAEGRRLALAGDVAAAHETLNRAMDAGSAVAAYLDAQVRLFAFPGDWYEATLRDGVLDNDHVMAAIDDDHLRGDLVPMYLALTRPDQVRPPAAWARWLTSFVPRLAAQPGRPTGDDEQDDRAWDAFAATLAGDPVPDPGPFGHACAAARELVEFGRPDDAWTELRNALPSWQPDSPLRVMPTVLITDPALRTIMTPERRLIAAITRRSR
ncbi:SMI1/KNR4 family protein [Nocardia carnea]|uniref:SMI1/KNR4 family protein n=1 Tax=Nocardia carnea TaxID=37328 RepID=UPI00245783F0|nr:SMI1/KNR4 family protein [Nocardia carnea]